jgi:ferredoxin
MELYYFSGTGNSLHVARELQRSLSVGEESAAAAGEEAGDTAANMAAAADAEERVELIPMLRHLHEEEVVTKSRVVGLVFPIYLSAMPFPVREFVEKLNVSSAEYLFAALTRIGTFHIADLQLRRILRRKNARLDAFFIMNMAVNSPCGLMKRGVPGFEKMVEEWPGRIAPEKVQELEEGVMDKIELIRQTVRARRGYFEGGGALSAAGKRINSVLMSATEGMTRRQRIPFYADDDCTGCGLCEDVCLSGRIEMADGRPLWQQEKPCYFCYACFNSCPEQAILIDGRYEKKLGRYLHPEISAEEIAAQKR